MRDRSEVESGPVESGPKDVVIGPEPLLRYWDCMVGSNSWGFSLTGFGEPERKGGVSFRSGFGADRGGIGEVGG